jgi:mono/diheme cytochrome c family protein
MIHWAQCCATIALACCIVATGALAQLNGPMSSTRTEPAAAPPATAQSTGNANASLDVEKLFAGTCGWCHANAGHTAGKGPQLMGTTLTDAEIINRIKNGKTGAMPAFGSTFNDDQLKAIVAYIRALRPDGEKK